MAFLMSGSFVLDAIGVVITLFLIIFACFKWSHGYWKRRNFPYMQPSFPFGNLGNVFAAKKMSIHERMDVWYKFGKDLKLKHFGMFFANKPVYFVMDLNLIKNILATDFEYWVDRGNYVNEKADPLSVHLFNLGGERWKTLRRKLTPTFTSGKMKLMFKTIADCGIFLEQAMEEKLKNKDSIDIKDMLGKFTTDVIGSCAFGLECNSFKDETEFRHYGKQIFRDDRLTVIKRSLIQTFPIIGHTLNISFLDQETSDFFIKAVKDTVRYRKENNVTRKDFLQILIDNTDEDSTGGNVLTTMEMAAQAFVFFVAGFETSSTTMTFALYEMSLHQEIQDKVRKEIMQVLARHNGQISYESMMEMKYMEQVINETLRKYPPVPAITRECIRDYKVPGSDLTLEKGTLAFIPINSIHYDEEHYPDSEKFNPDRFSDGNKQNIKPFSHLAFGGGRRECIGERFGILQTKVGLVTLLKNYVFTLSKKTQMPLKMDPRQFITTAQGDIWLDYQRI